MGLATALLQPRIFRRLTPDAEAALVDDVLRLVVLVAEDAAANGPLAPALREAFLSLSSSLEAQLTPRLAAAQDKLLALIAAPRAYVESLASTTSGIKDDPSQILSVLRDLLADIKALVGSFTLPRIREQLEVLREIIQDDLQLTPAFLSKIIVDFLDAAATGLTASSATDTAQRRRLRLAAAIVIRLRLQLVDIELPGIAMEPLARLIYDQIEKSRVKEALDQINCAMDAIETVLDAAIAAGSVVRPALQPINAGIVPAEIAEYSWYASWILSDEDLPLLGLSDVKDAKALVQLLRQPPHALATYLRDKLSPAQRLLVDAPVAAGEDPSREAQLTVLGIINQVIQREPILALPAAQGLPALSEASLSDDIKELRGSFLQDQKLLDYNRLVVDAAFPSIIEPVSSGFSHWLGTSILSILAWPRHQVIVTADRRFVMCDDMPIHVGADLSWNDAPIFAEHNPGQFHYNFGFIGAEACEIIAQVLFTAGEAGKALWHFVDMQPGHRVQTGIIGSVEIADTLQQILFGKPLSAHFLELDSFPRAWGKSLDSAVGLKGVTTFITSFQGKHSAATGGNIFWFWAIVLLSDIIRNLGPIKTIGSGRDALLSLITLFNTSKAPDGTPGLPDNPPANYKKQDPVVGIVDTLFAMLLASLYDPDNYSILIWSKDGIGDRRKSAMLRHWLGGSLGMGIASGVLGGGLSRLVSWSSDWGLFFKTIGISAAKSFLLFWFFNYLFKENKTDGGQYRPGSGRFSGYPDKKTSPYRLPFATGTSLMVSQANLGLFSHNYISNFDFVTGNSATLQTYAYDFGHDFDEGIACARAGVVWSFSESIPDSDTSDWNVIIIRHSGAPDAVHDKVGGTAVTTYAVYGHLATNGVTRAPAFATPPIQESLSPGAGTPVNQGDIIALAGDTGLSFHNHLHMHILPDDGTGKPDFTIAIPFVFVDAPGDGVLKSRTWYTAGAT